MSDVSGNEARPGRTVVVVDEPEGIVQLATSVEVREVAAGKRRVLVDGRNFPWATHGNVEMSAFGSGRLATVTLTMLVDGPVSIQPRWYLSKAEGADHKGGPTPQEFEVWMCRWADTGELVVAKYLGWDVPQWLTIGSDEAVPGHQIIPVRRLLPDNVE